MKQSFEKHPLVGPSFSVRNRVARSLWQVIYVLLFKFSLRTSHQWRVLILRLFGAKIGQGCRVYRTATIWAPWNLEMDDHATLGDDVICYSMDKVYLGKNSIVSQGSYLCTGTHDYESPDFTLYTRPIKIYKNAWVCAQAFICPGVIIGEGAVIGARSVVTKNMPDWMVCGGNPCKPLKARKNPGYSD